MAIIKGVDRLYGKRFEQNNFFTFQLKDPRDLTLSHAFFSNN